MSSIPKDTTAEILSTKELFERIPSSLENILVWMSQEISRNAFDGAGIHSPRQDIQSN